MVDVRGRCFKNKRPLPGKKRKEKKKCRAGKGQDWLRRQEKARGLPGREGPAQKNGPLPGGKPWKREKKQAQGGGLRGN